ncbi:MAG: hypothetical protein WAU48_06205 [Gammaproteobacteria bacterium]
MNVSDMNIEHFSIAERFRGPPRSGNGGYVCGRVARHWAGPATVRLKAPPPLETGLRLEYSESRAQLLDGTVLIAEGKSSTLELEMPPAPPYARAELASRSFIGFRQHHFPGCFVCGPDRAPGDGLRIFPGTDHAGAPLAAPWIPDASLCADSGNVAPEFLWSALDCTGAFALLPAPAGMTLVLGELCASIEGSAMPGEHCIVLGWPLQTEGRKHLAGSAVFSAEGALIARAKAVWIEVPLDRWT